MFWLILILISAFFVGLRVIYAKEALYKDETLSFLFWVALFLSIFMLLIFNKRIDFLISSKVYLLIILKSLVISVSWYCLYEAYKNMEISLASPLVNLTPIFVLILGITFLGDKISLLQLLGIIILVASAYLLEVDIKNKKISPINILKNKYIILIIISLLLTSISAILDKVVIRYTNYYTILTFFYIFITIFFLPILLIKKRKKDIIYAIKQTPLLVILVSIFMLVADISYFIAVAIPTTLISLIIPVRGFSTFFSTLIGGRLFREGHVIKRSIICLIMIFAVYLIVV